MGSSYRQVVPSTALCPPLVGVDSSAGGGLYNIARQRASHDFPANTCTDDLEAVGLRRLTGANVATDVHAGEAPPRGLVVSTSALHIQHQHSPAACNDSNNTSAEFEWDFGGEDGQQHQQQQQNREPATKRLDHLVQQQHQRFGSLDRRRRRLLNASMDADVKGSSLSCRYYMLTIIHLPNQSDPSLSVAKSDPFSHSLSCLSSPLTKTGLESFHSPRKRFILA